jgi:hypothetical protein
MDDLLCLVNHPLRCNVAGIPTSQNPDTLEGLENRLSVGIHRIPIELPHSTKPELRKLRQTRTDSDRASTLELLWGLPTSWEALRPSGSRLSLCNLAGRPGFLLASPFPHWILLLPTYFNTWWKWVLEMCQQMVGRPRWCRRPATPWLGWACALCHVISLCHIVCDYALFWT